MLFGKFTLQTPVKPATVAQRELTVTKGDGSVVIPLALDQVETEELAVGVAGDVIETSLVDVDQSGNRSAAQVQTWTIADTIAPDQPGPVGLVVTREE